MRARRSVRQTTGGSDPTGLTPGTSVPGHVLIPVQENGEGGRAWIGGCSCGITVQALEATAVVAQLQAHLEWEKSKGKPKTAARSKVAISQTARARRGQLSGSTVSGQLRPTNPGWVLARDDGLDLPVDVTRVAKPALLSGTSRSWRIVEKRDGRWVIELVAAK